MVGSVGIWDKPNSVGINALLQIPKLMLCSKFQNASFVVNWNTIIA
jgi:hypothetical protein